MKTKKELREELREEFFKEFYRKEEDESMIGEMMDFFQDFLEKALQAKEEERVGEIEKLKQQDEDNPFQTCFECESTMSIYGECPHCGSPIRYADNDYNQAIDDILSSLKKGETK